MARKKSIQALLGGLVLIGGLLAAEQAHALTLYGNNAGFGTDIVEVFDVDVAAGTASKINDYTNITGNGRGVVVVGDVVYTTVVGDNHIYMTNRVSGLTIGSIATSQASMSTIAFDGTNFWTTDYSGTNQGFYIDAVTGLTLKTVTFSLATGYMDGMEYFNGKLIVNRTDGGFGGPIVYDVYDLDGNLLTANFITSQNGTGIAYDGANFLVSDIFNNQINVFDGTSGAFMKNIYLGSTGHLIEDLSVDYATRPDTGTVPEPMSLILLGSGLTGLVAMRRRMKL
ncbi:MAG: VPLPA-CTERM sorting domain-containing protein [Nitrospira sp.]|nr:VPLPA-CTERM sorting domain-containing protein [Nitrospira sp.]